MSDQSFSAEEIDTSRPHPARMYDYYLGGRDNYEVDRDAAEQVIQELPEIIPAARANRDFLQRTVRFVVESGIRQIIDIGTGIPTSPNTHEVGREIAPDLRVVYIDNDPIVAAHAGGRLTNTPGTRFVLADVRQPESLLEHPSVREFIDFGKPVAVLLVAVLHFVKDEENPGRIAAALADALPPGSFFVMSHTTADFHPDGFPQTIKVYNKAAATMNVRPHAEILSFFERFKLLDPGLVQVPLWRPEGPLPPPEELGKIGFYGGVGVKD